MRAQKLSVRGTRGGVSRGHAAVNLLVRAAWARDAQLAGDQGALAALVEEFKAINASQTQRPERHRSPLGRYVE